MKFFDDPFFDFLLGVTARIVSNVLTDNFKKIPWRSLGGTVREIWHSPAVSLSNLPANFLARWLTVGQVISAEALYFFMIAAAVLSFVGKFSAGHASELPTWLVPAAFLLLAYASRRWFLRLS